MIVHKKYRFILQKRTSLPYIFIKSFYAVKVSWTEEIDKALDITKDSAYSLIIPTWKLSQFTLMYGSLHFRNYTIFSIVSTVSIYIVSYIFCFCEVIFGSRNIQNHAIDPTNIDKHYLFWIYCSIVLLETFPVCRVAGWLDLLKL